MKAKITIGDVAFEGFQRPDATVQVILHSGKAMQELCVTTPEWQSLEQAAASLVVAARRAAGDLAEINRMQLQRDEARVELARAKQERDAARSEIDALREENRVLREKNSAFARACHG